MHCWTPAIVLLCWIVVAWEEDKLYGCSVGEEEGGGSRARLTCDFLSAIIAPRARASLPTSTAPCSSSAAARLGAERCAWPRTSRRQTTTAQVSWWPASSSPSPPFPRAQPQGQLRHPGVQSYCWLVGKSIASFLSLFSKIAPFDPVDDLSPG